MIQIINYHQPLLWIQIFKTEADIQLENNALAHFEESQK